MNKEEKRTSEQSCTFKDYPIQNKDQRTKLYTQRTTKMKQGQQIKVACSKNNQNETRTIEQSHELKEQPNSSKDNRAKS